MKKQSELKKFILPISLISLSIFAEKKPNIIYILADDAGIGDIGCYGQKKIKTPNIDAMAKDGIKFTQHYSGSTVCGPSRSCLMTGQHTGHTTIRGNGKISLKSNDVTIPQLLKKAGYTTGVVGKWGLGETREKQMEGKTPGAAHNRGFDRSLVYESHVAAHHYYPNFLWKNGKKELYPNNPQKRTHYSHDLFTNFSLDFIKENKSKPFFLYVAYTTPHVDLDVPDDSMKPYLKPFAPERPYKGSHYRSHKTPHACFAGMISRMDRDVGKIRQLLKDLNIDQNTLVIFTSDNGATPAGGADPKFFNSNGEFRGIKRDLYEGGVRAPHLAVWPKVIKPGTTTDHISAQWDFMATACDITGLKTPENSDGISFLPTLLNQPNQQKKHSHLYWEFFERGGKQAVRKGDWKAVRLNVNSNRNAPIELYNLANDIGETKNIAAKYPEIVAEMEKLMRTSRTESPYFKFANKKNKKRRKNK